MQIEISQSLQFKYSIVYVAKDAISYNCFTTIMQHFVVKKCFYLKTPDGAASISSPSFSNTWYTSNMYYLDFTLTSFLLPSSVTNIRFNTL